MITPCTCGEPLRWQRLLETPATRVQHGQGEAVFTVYEYDYRMKGADGVWAAYVSWLGRVHEYEESRGEAL